MTRQLRRRDPFNDLWNFPDEVGRLFWGIGQHTPEGESSVSFLPAVDVTEDKESMTIRADLPGVAQNDIKVNVKDGILTLRGDRKAEHEEKDENYYRLERSSGSFARSFTLPKTVDSDNIHATMKDGVLELKIPKKPEAKEKEIEVKVH